MSSCNLKDIPPRTLSVSRNYIKSNAIKIRQAAEQTENF